jgi:tetratricopeptide (TPR) repeat protein
VSRTLRGGLLFVLALVVWLTPLARAQDGHTRALEAYGNASYDVARTLWLAELERADPAAPDRARVLYNLGNTAFRLKRPLEAAAWYTAALRLDPRDENAWHNLEFVRREAGLDPADRGDLSATARRFASSLTLPESERLVLGVAALLGLALAWEALRGSQASRATSLVLAGVLALALVPWLWRLTHAGEQPVFVVQPEGAALLSEPRAEATLIGRVPAAEQAERVDALPGWLRVRTAGGETGWVAAESVIPLDAPYR